MRGSHRRRAAGSRGAGCPAPQADRRRGGAGAGPQGPHADHREPPRPGAGRRRGGRIQRRRRRTGPAARSIPTPAPRAAHRPCASDLGVDVGVVVTDTMGRAWRNGQTDVAIGVGRAAGAARLRRAHDDSHGNELLVTEVAVADEIAAAADLVKGKLTGSPGGGGARTDAARRRLHRGAAWCAPARTTCSGSAPPRRSTWAAARPSCCAARCAGSPPSPVDAGAHRGGRRRGADRAGAAPHPAGAVRLAARPRPARPRCSTR